MMGTAEAENLEKYKSYIQRRRVGLKETDESLPAEPLTDRYGRTDGYVIKSENGKNSDTDDYNYTQNDNDEELRKFLEEEPTWKKSYSDTYSSSISTTSYRRNEPDLYRRLYGRNRRTPYSSRNTGSFYGSSRYASETEDNGAALLAIKVIKQCLACFAVLGVIVLMQKINSMAGVLEFLKKHIVDTHIEPESILAGAEELIKECTRLLGGSP